MPKKRLPIHEVRYLSDDRVEISVTDDESWEEFIDIAKSVLPPTALLNPIPFEPHEGLRIEIDCTKLLPTMRDAFLDVLEQIITAGEIDSDEFDLDKFRSELLASGDYAEHEEQMVWFECEFCLDFSVESARLRLSCRCSRR